MFVEHADSPAQVAKPVEQPDPNLGTFCQPAAAEQATVVAITEQVLALPPPPDRLFDRLLDDIRAAELRMTARERAWLERERLLDPPRTAPDPFMVEFFNAISNLELVNCVPGRHQLLSREGDASKWVPIEAI